MKWCGYTIMRYAFLADIHANEQALLSCLDYCDRAIKPDIIIVLGDLVGYGASPNECIDMIRGCGCYVIAGNHDWACAGFEDITLFNPAAQHSILWTRSVLTEENRDFLSGLEYKIKGKEFYAVHASPRDPLNEYIASEDVCRKSIEAVQEGILFVGHTHIPCCGVLSSDGTCAMRVLHEGAVRIPGDARIMINCGSVGQPRDNDKRCAIGVYDTEKAVVEIVRIEYDIRAAQKGIMDAGLPEILARRLAKGT